MEVVVDVLLLDAKTLQVAAGIVPEELNFVDIAEHAASAAGRHVAVTGASLRVPVAVPHLEASQEVTVVDTGGDVDGAGPGARPLLIEHADHVGVVRLVVLVDVDVLELSSDGFGQLRVVIAAAPGPGSHSEVVLAGVIAAVGRSIVVRVVELVLLVQERGDVSLGALALGDELGDAGRALSDLESQKVSIVDLAQVLGPAVLGVQAEAVQISELLLVEVLIVAALIVERKTIEVNPSRLGVGWLLQRAAERCGESNRLARNITISITGVVRAVIIIIRLDDDGVGVDVPGPDGDDVLVVGADAVVVASSGILVHNVDAVVVGLVVLGVVALARQRDAGVHVGVEAALARPVVLLVGSVLSASVVEVVHRLNFARVIVKVCTVGVSETLSDTAPISHLFKLISESISDEHALTVLGVVPVLALGVEEVAVAVVLDSVLPLKEVIALVLLLFIGFISEILHDYPLIKDSLVLLADGSGLSKEGAQVRSDVALKEVELSLALGHLALLVCQVEGLPGVVGRILVRNPLGVLLAVGLPAAANSIVVVGLVGSDADLVGHAVSLQGVRDGQDGLRHSGAVGLRAHGRIAHRVVESSLSVDELIVLVVACSKVGRVEAGKSVDAIDVGRIVLFVSDFALL